MRRLLQGVSVLLGVLSMGGCSSGEATESAPSELTVVLGAGNTCAATIRSVDLAISPGEFETMNLPVEKPTSLPLSAKVALPVSETAVYTVAATFHIQTGDGKESEVPLSIKVPTGTTGRIVMSMPCVCIGSFCPEETRCAQLPQGSGKTQCLAADLCGNSKCEGNENGESCPQDCSAGCGDGTCAADEEGCDTCPSDCGTCCGDGQCSEDESCSICAQDCGVCAVCGNKLCEAGEDESCGDCTAGCGDGDCSSSESSKGTCPADCGASCGNGVCELGETCSTCVGDCGVCPLCGDGVCSSGETCGNCPSDCSCSCGNGTCESHEDCKKCSKDCGLCQGCGDKTCGSGETCSNCPNDCIAQSCGDGICSCNESNDSCSKDCVASCGNGSCDAVESHKSCPVDCLAVCGDTVCDEGEAVLLCPECEGVGGQGGSGGAAGKGGSGGQSGAGGAAGMSGGGGAGGVAGSAGNAGAGGVSCTPSAEVCDGKDNDCDGKVDEDDPGGGASCDTSMQVGECAKGTMHCTSGKLSCVQNTPASNEVCDGKDNDCDGQVDNGPLADQTGTSCLTNQPGVCSSGSWVCASGKLSCVGAASPGPETCNGLDDDCNGEVDDKFEGMGSECSVEGVPANSPCLKGTTLCDGGKVTCLQVIGAEPETCNGVDDDCDGKTDNNLNLESSCVVPGAQGVCVAGTPMCASGQVNCVQIVQAEVEQCDGLDNDCDGQADNGDPNVMCAIAGANVASWSCGGTCNLTGCNAGFANLDGDKSNGCECATDTNATSCGGAATVVVPFGGSSALTGVVDAPSGEDWFLVQFADPGAGVSWHPQLSLGGAYGSEYIMDTYSSCGVAFGCNADGGGAEPGEGITVWERKYLGYTPGAGCCPDNDGRPSLVWVRIRRRNGDTPTCHPFEVTALNP